MRDLSDLPLPTSLGTMVTYRSEGPTHKAI